MNRCESANPGKRKKWLFLLSLGATILGACASTGLVNFHLEPLKGERASFSHEGLTLTSIYLDVDGRNEHLRASGQEALSRELHGLSLTTFLFRAANESGQETIIDPSGTRLLAGFGPPLSPMSYAHLYVDLPRSPARHRVLKGLQGIAFDRPLIVPPGGSVEKVIFFRRPEKVGEKVNIVFGALYLGGSQVGQAVLSFRALPLEE